MRTYEAEAGTVIVRGLIYPQLADASMLPGRCLLAVTRYLAMQACSLQKSFPDVDNQMKHLIHVVRCMSSEVYLFICLHLLLL